MRSAVARLLSIACLTYFSFVLPTQAKDPISEQLKKFTQSDAHKKLVTEAFSNLPTNVFQRCPTLVSKGPNVEVGEVSFGSNGQPNAGAWKVSFKISGCGNDTTFRIYFYVNNKSGEIDSIIAVPGETRGDITLQRDAVKYARMAASIVAKTCQTFNVKNTRLDRAKSKNPSWREIWTMVGCNRTFDVPLTFSPSADGGTDIHQNTGTVVERH